MLNSLDCLYYPYSRLLDGPTLKYLLLIFDSITFIDQISPDFRNDLLIRMAMKNSYFAPYLEINNDLRQLHNDGIVKIINPKEISSGNSEELALSVLSDLSDRKFINLASPTNLEGVPLIKGKPVWDIFPGKIPHFLKTEKCLSNNIWNKQIIECRGEDTNWTVSYAAGSSLAINFYLDAADKLKKVPVTTSDLHHLLLVYKLKKLVEPSEVSLINEPLRLKISACLGYAEVINLLEGIIPTCEMNNISLEEIVEFRKKTEDQRKAFIKYIQNVTRLIDKDPQQSSYDKEIFEAIKIMQDNFLSLENELIEIRNEVFPSLVKSFMAGSASGSALAAVVTFFGGITPGGLISASAMTVGATMINELLGLERKKKKVLSDKSTSMTYLLKMREFKGPQIKKIIHKLDRKIHTDDKQSRNQNIHQNSY